MSSNLFSFNNENLSNAGKYAQVRIIPEEEDKELASAKITCIYSVQI